MLDCKCGTSVISFENTQCNYKLSNYTNMKLDNDLVFATKVSSPTFYNDLRQRVRTGVNILV